MDTPLEAVGFIGLGRMGASMASNLLRAGFTVSVHDAVAERAVALAGQGATACASAADVASRSAIVVIMVIDDAQVRDVVLGMDGVLQSAKVGTILMICSSVQPMTCAELAERCRPRGVAVISAPVTRGEQGARDGTLLFLVGGEPTAVDRCRALMAAMGKDVFHVGDDPGAGQVAKTVNNLMLWAGFIATYEGFSLAQAFDLRLDVLRQAISVSTGTNSSVERWDRAVDAPWAEKDMVNTMEVADQLHLPLPLSATVKEQVKALKHASEPPRVPTPWHRARGDGESA